MQAEKRSLPRPPQRAAALCLCVCFVGVGAARAQKNPSIFKTEGRDNAASMSATSMEYIRSLESQYRSLEATDKEGAKRIRNKLIYIGVEQIDTYFNDYRRKSRKRNELIQFLLDFLEIGASTAIAITNGERAKEVIAEALNGFKGGRSSLNKNFRLLETQILFNKMVANRSDRLGQIYEQLNAEVDSYPWERARSELKGYLYAGTIDDALNSLSIETGAIAGAAQRQLEGIKERAGILSALPAQVVTESRANAALIDPVVDAFVAADDKFKEADAVIAEADKKIAEADKKLADAEKKIKEAKEKSPPDDAAVAQGTEEKAAATAAKAAATTEKTKATEEKAAATKTRDAGMAKLRAVYAAVAKDSGLSPLIDRVPQERQFGAGDPATKVELEASVRRLKAGTGTFEDHADILRMVNDLALNEIPRNPALSRRMQEILKANQ